MYMSAPATYVMAIRDWICMLAVTSRNITQPSVSVKMIEVSSLRYLCATIFFLSRSRIAFFSQKKSMCTRAAYRSPLKFIASKVSPNRMHIRMARKIAKVIPVY